MQRFGRYRILDEVGEGSFGIVYRARDERLEREVALKVLREGCLRDPAIRERFELEARVLSRLNHPNIEILYDFESRDGDDFLVMEFIPGETLKQKLDSGALAEKEVVHLGTQLCDALHAAHQSKVIHRDLKPGNLIVKPDGQLKVLDFGVAKLLRSTNQPLDPSDTLTATGTIVGTIPYLTPEQLRGEPAEVRSDIHCVGAILYEMSTGRRPFAGTGTTLVANILNQVPTPPRLVRSEVSEDLEAIILKCLEKHMEDRYQTAEQLGSELRALGSGAARVQHLGKRRRPRNWRVLAPVLGALALALLLVLPVMTPVQKGVAVLPFESLGGGDQEYYADAVADQLFNKLVAVSDLPVTPRSSARAVDRTQPLRRVAQSLGVNALVDGTVLRADGEIRVSISVARIQRPRWLFGRGQAETVYADERTFAESDLLRELAAFATHIADGLVETLKPEDRERLADARMLHPEAFDRYAQGRHEWARRTPQAFQNAIQFFEESIQADSTFALAYAGLADCYALFGSFGYDIMPPKHAMPQARAYARTALRHDETLAEAHTALAHILHNFDWDWDGAREEFERAIVLSPGNSTAYQWYGFYFATMGRLDEAIHWQKKGLEKAPNSAVTLASLGRMYYYKRDFAKAIEYLERALERDRNFLPSTILLGGIYTQLGRLDEATQIFEAGRVVTQGAAVFEAGMGAVHAASGNDVAAQSIIHQLEARETYVPSYYLAAIYTKMGAFDRAIDALEEAVGERSEAVLYIGVDPWLDDLRAEPRFRELLRRIGIPFEVDVSLLDTRVSAPTK